MRKNEWGQDACDVGDVIWDNFRKSCDGFRFLYHEEHGLYKKITEAIKSGEVSEEKYTYLDFARPAEELARQIHINYSQTGVSISEIREIISERIATRFNEHHIKAPGFLDEVEEMKKKLAERRHA